MNLDKYKSRLTFLGFRVLKMQFEINEECRSGTFSIDLDLDVDYKYSETDNERHCILFLYASLFKNASQSGEQYPFIFDVTINGIFSALKEDIDEEKFQRLVEKNGTAILFPYLRSIICDASKMANISPILIPSMNIGQFIDDKKKADRL